MATMRDRGQHEAAEQRKVVDKLTSGLSSEELRQRKIDAEEQKQLDDLLGRETLKAAQDAGLHLSLNWDTMRDATKEALIKQGRNFSINTGSRIADSGDISKLGEGMRRAFKEKVRKAEAAEAERNK